VFLRAILKSIVPQSVRLHLIRLLGPLWSLPHCLAVSLAQISRSEQPRVFYGRWRIPSVTRQTFGGMVKVQWMQETFANSPNRFNILYMVSSQMPLGAAQIASASRKKGARFVWNQNGVAYPGWHGSGWEIRNTLMEELLHQADYVVYQSNFCKAGADRYLRRRQGPWEILYNAVDTSRFTPILADPAPGRLILLLGGNQYPYYRFESAVHAVAAVVRSHVDAQLLVTGQLGSAGEVTDMARDLVGRLGLSTRVVFLGPYTQFDAPRIYQKAHILLHTKYNDPCPGVVIEAMSCGLPVVYSATGGVPELVGKDAGIGVPAELCWDRDVPPDPEALAKAVLEVAEGRKLYAHAARQRAVEMFDLKAWLRRHQEIFEKLLSPSHREPDFTLPGPPAHREGPLCRGTGSCPDGRLPNA